MSQDISIYSMEEYYDFAYENGTKSDIPFDNIICWINAFLQKTKTPNKSCSSYGLKHLCEHCFNSYVSNEDMKKAMVKAGFLPVNPYELNWYFCISKRSPIFLMDKEKVKDFYESSRPNFAGNDDVKSEKGKFLSRLMNILDSYLFSEPDELVVDVEINFLKANGEDQNKIITYHNPDYEYVGPLPDLISVAALLKEAKEFQTPDYLNINNYKRRDK